MQIRSLTRRPVRLAEEEPAAAVRDSQLDSLSPGQTYRTIMFSDIEGFAAMTERLRDRRALETLHTDNVTVRERGAAYGGFEVIEEAGDFFGKNVILSARIANEARGSQILVSPLLKALIERVGGFTFGLGREVKLRGLSGWYRLSTVEA